MLVHKDYQTSPSLQAIYNAKSSISKLFSGIESRCTPGKFKWLNRDPLAKDAGVGTRQANRLILKLEEDLKVIERQTHGTKVAHASAYRITPLGYQVLHIFQQINKINKYAVMTTCLLLSPVETNVSRVKLNVFIKEVSSSSSYSKLQTAPARETQNTPILLTTARKEVDVGSMEHKTMDLPEHVVSLTPILQLTTHGQLKLSIFDKETIDYCWAAVKQANSCKDVFKELVELCLKYYKDNDRRPDWPAYFDALEAGLAAKTDRYTSRTITSGMIKPRVVRDDSVMSSSQESLKLTEKEKMRQRQKEWEDKQNPEDLERKRRAACGDINRFTHPNSADVISVLEEVEVVEAKPIEWSQTDKAVVDWVLKYIQSMTYTRNGYAPLEQEILMGPDSPRARTGELQAGLRLMQRMVYQELADREPKTPVEKVVTQIKDQIVCAQIENDDRTWENMTYVPLGGDEVLEEIF